MNHRIDIYSDSDKNIYPCFLKQAVTFGQNISLLIIINTLSCYVKVMALCVSLHLRTIQKLLEDYFKIKARNSLVDKKIKNSLCEDGTEKSVPQDHCL